MKTAVVILNVVVIALAWFSWTLHSRIDDLEGTQTISPTQVQQQLSDVQNQIFKQRQDDALQDSLQRTRDAQYDAMRRQEDAIRDMLQR